MRISSPIGVWRSTRGCRTQAMTASSAENKRFVPVPARAVDGKGLRIPDAAQWNTPGICPRELSYVSDCQITTQGSPRCECIVCTPSSCLSIRCRSKGSESFRPFRRNAHHGERIDPSSMYRRGPADPMGRGLLMSRFMSRKSPAFPGNPRNCLCRLRAMQHEKGRPRRGGAVISH